MLTISRWLIDGTEFLAFGSETFVRITAFVARLRPLSALCEMRRRTQNYRMMTVKVLHAFLLTRPPANARRRQNTISFPIKAGRYQRNPLKTGEWNRGAYSAQALSGAVAPRGDREYDANRPL